MLTDFPLIGRADQVAEVLAQLGQPVTAAVYLVGPAGVGKSRLGSAVLTQARRLGHQVCSVSATQACAQIPFAAVAELLPERGEHELVSRFELFRLAGDAVRRRVLTGRLVVLVDDVHLLDEASAALLHHLAATGQVFLVGTARAGEPLGDPLLSLWRQGRAAWLPVPPLGEAAVAELLAVVLGGQVDGGAAHELHRLSAGNPLYLRELIRAGLESSRLRETGGLWRLHGVPGLTLSLEELLSSWLRGVAAPARAAAEVVAFAEPLGASLLRRVVPLAALEQAEAAGLVRLVLDGRREQLRLTHPLIGELLRAATPRLRAMGIRARLAHALAQTGLRRRGDALRLGLWQLAANSSGDAELLLAAAGEAAAVFDHDLTIRLAQAARAAGAGQPALQLEATAIAWLGRTSSAEPLFAELERRANGDGERAAAALMRASNLWLGLGRARAAQLVVHAAEAVVAQPDSRALLGAVRAFMLVQSGHSTAGLSVCEAALGDASGPAAMAHLLPVYVQALADSGRTGRALAVVAELPAYQAQTEQFPYLGEGYGLAHVTALEHAGRLTEAEALTASQYRRALDRHSDQARAAWACFRGRIALRTGKIASAIGWLREGIGLHRTAMTLSGPVGQLDALAALGTALVLLNDLDAADLVFGQTCEVARDGDVFAATVDIARGWLLVARGQPEQAYALLEKTADHTAELGRLAMTQRALHAMARLGAADRCGERLAELARCGDGLLPGLYADHAAALVAMDPVALDECSARFAAIGAVLEAAEAASSAAGAYRRRGAAGSRPAAVAAERAHALLARCEGARLVGPLHAGVAAALTTREREIAVLAAAGLANRDLAAQLSLSVRTIENHLHSVYRKLGLGGRAELSECLLSRTA